MIPSPIQSAKLAPTISYIQDLEVPRQSELDQPVPLKPDGLPEVLKALKVRSLKETKPWKFLDAESKEKSPVNVDPRP